jgi:putative methanogen marker protein 4
MGILKVIEKKARKTRAKIAIGAGRERAGYTEKVLKAAEAVDFADVTVVGSNLSTETDVSIFDSADAEKDLISLLKTGEVDAAVRGTCKASKALREINVQFKPERIGRMALLETVNGHEFFFAPVGIDEGNTLEERIFLINEGIKLGWILGIKLEVGVLSGGRKSDVGRHNKADNTIKDAERAVRLIRKTGFYDITNYNILVEDAVSEKANFIIAPDGITGNLMFRTLAFLGGGRGYGAVLSGLDKVYIDTSRAGSFKDYKVAMMLAGALAG